MRMISSRSRASRWLTAITSARSGSVLLGAALLLGYAALPLGVATFLDVDSSFLVLAGVTTACVAALALGARTPFLDPWFSGRLPRLQLSAAAFNAALWSTFVAFVFVAWATAPQIPLLAALAGADPDTIAVLREQFLKAREGWQSSFVYINAILSGALIPYSLALMFLHGVRMRWLATGFFLLFCVSFVEKAFFFKAALPLLYLVAQGKAKTQLSPRVLLLGTLGILLVVTFFSGAGSADTGSGDPFFSVTYVPQGGVQHLIWRSIAIPLVTAADAIRVLETEFGGRPLWGATSSFVAGLSGVERIEFERLVFAAQWGQNETGTGSSNSVFLTEAFVNFGWLGVVVFGYVVGLLLRLFAVSRDEAFRALWLLFALGAYTSGLIGLLLSNGFILLFAMALFVRLRVRTATDKRPAQHEASFPPPKPI